MIKKKMTQKVNFKRNWKRHPDFDERDLDLNGVQEKKKMKSKKHSFSLVLMFLNIPRAKKHITIG